MDAEAGCIEHESSAKRIKLDVSESSYGALCGKDGFSNYPISVDGPIDVSEGLSVDCDSGYEASTLESVPTPLQHNTSPNTDSDYNQEIFPESFYQTPTPIDNLDTSQDSIYPDDDNASTVSELSGLSELSGQNWKPMAGSMVWIQKQMHNGVNPRLLLSELGVDQDQIPEYVDEVTLWKLIINMLAEPPRRNKLRHVNTLDDVVRLLKGAQNIIVLTGAGVSVSCGIPDFRSRDGIYSRLAADFPDLPDPQAMFDIGYFSQDPRPFFKFARDIYPGKFKPSPCHRFIKLLEKHCKLLRNYTQNIDTLERCANIERVVECHGSFSTATCTKCGYKVTAEEIRDTVLSQEIPLCKKCQPESTGSVSTGEQTDYRKLVSQGIMKPDIVFFGEGLPDLFHEAMTVDKLKCDLLLVIGSSLKVRPVALIPSSLPPNVPQILINREPLPHCHFDVELLGDCDVIINHLCHLLGSAWEEGIYSQVKLKEAQQLLPLEDQFLTGESVRSAEISNCSKTEPNTEETEPNCTVYEKLNMKRQENLCNCIFSTKSSSLTVDKDLKSLCTCNVDYEKQMSIINKQSIPAISKERHVSVDSARDSGIGENSNLDTLKYDDSADDLSEVEKEVVTAEEISTGNGSCTTSLEDMRGLWQPKIKRSLVDRLPSNSYHLVLPSRYIFPGAEVYYDPDENYRNSGDSDSDSSDNDECEALEASPF